MPIYMDLHIVPGVNAKDVASAHSMDVLMEKEHSCKCLTYWIDELRGYVFCLIDAPDKESVTELHSRAHGLVPNKIIEVEPGLVHSFLGRITDPENAKTTESGLLILDDTSFRVIMQIQLADRVSLHQSLGHEKAGAVISQLNNEIKAIILKNNGRECSRDARTINASFISGEFAFEAARHIMQRSAIATVGISGISIHAGEPVMQSDELFGDTLQLLSNMNQLGCKGGITITTAVQELLPEKLIQQKDAAIKVLSPEEEAFIRNLSSILEQHYREEDFDLDTCSSQMAMSTSQLYRKAKAISGLPPNRLLRQYRISKACDLLRRSDTNISTVSFDTGFNDPSYFTKCFKAVTGVLPATYMEWARK